MKINSLQASTIKPLVPGPRSPEQELAAARELKQAYSDFVGKTFFGQMLKAMRSTVGKPAYFHGGQAEEMFRAQLDQHLADGMNPGIGATGTYDSRRRPKKSRNRTFENFLDGFTVRLNLPTAVTRAVILN